MYCMMFFINISSTVGYAEFQPFNDMERIFAILCVYIGSSCFALGFGLFQSHLNLLGDNYI